MVSPMADDSRNSSAQTATTVPSSYMQDSSELGGASESFQDDSYKNKSKKTKSKKKKDSSKSKKKNHDGSSVVTFEREHSARNMNPISENGDWTDTYNNKQYLHKSDERNFQAKSKGVQVKSRRPDVLRNDNRVFEVIQEAMETNQDAEGLDSKVYGADCVSVLTDDDINEFISTMGGGDIITKDLLVKYLVSVGAESNFSDELASNFISRLQADNIRKNPALKPAVMSNQIPRDMIANPNLSNRFGPVTGVDQGSAEKTNMLSPFSDPSSYPSHREIGYGEDTSDLPMYYEDTDKLGFKEKMKKPYVWLIVLLCVGVLVTVISVFMKKAKKETYSGGQTMTPSSAPTFLSEDMLQAAIKLSGKDSFASELSPQYRAVSWLSSVDQTTYDTFGPSFKQRYAIVIIYYSLEGENWNQQEDWLNPGKHECDWSESIFCEYNEAEERKFTDFDRSESNLSGSLPPEIGLLTTAKSFRIHGNNIRGSIPSTIGSLSLLSVLDCNSNRLSGSIPSEIGGARNLIWLDISRNTLESTIPITMFLLSSLREVNLSWNRISGSLRSEVGNLDALVTLDLSHNHLTGTIPPELDELPNLSIIRFEYNELGGSLPLVTANFLKREVISLSHNQFTGSFAFLSSVLESQLNPDDEQLHVLDLSYNKLSGPISNVFAHLQRISYIDISENAFAGSIPEVFVWPDLEHLSVASNALSGTFPLGWPKLTLLDVSHNQFSSNFPLDICKHTNLISLDAGDNSFSKDIPSCIGKLTDMTNLQMNQNQLTGSIPDSLENLVSLQNLNFSSNILTGVLPSKLRSMQTLEHLSFGQNKLAGSIPSEIGDLTNLKSLELNNNLLTGTLPSSLGLLVYLNRLIIKGNQLNGYLPSELCQLKNLTLTTSKIGCDISCDCCESNGNC